MTFSIGWSRGKLLRMNSEMACFNCFRPKSLMMKLMLLDFPAIRVDLVKNLRKDYKIYLFSNTNAIHVEKYRSNFRKQHGFEVSSLFVKDFHSNEIGYRK